MFIYVTKNLLVSVNCSTRHNFLRIKEPNILRNIYFHTISGNQKNFLFKNFNRQRITKFKSTSKNNDKNDSILSSYASLFIRRSRLDAKDALKSHPELAKVKVNTSGIRRLISLAKPEKYKIAFGMLLLVISSESKLAEYHIWQWEFVCEKDYKRWLWWRLFGYKRCVWIFRECLHC